MYFEVSIGCMFREMLDFCFVVKLDSIVLKQGNEKGKLLRNPIGFICMEMKLSYEIILHDIKLQNFSVSFKTLENTKIIYPSNLLSEYSCFFPLASGFFILGS